MAIAKEPGMSAKDVKAANDAVNKARIANVSKPDKPKAAAEPVVDGRASLARLTGGQTLTDADKAYLNIGAAPAAGGSGNTGGTGGDNPAKTITSQVDNKDGTFTITYSDGTTEVTGTKKTSDNPADTSSGLSGEQKDAYALIKDTFIKYGLEELVPAIQSLMDNNVGPNQASLLLKTDPKYNSAYIARFKGNETRRAAGLNVLSEGEYLALEDSYSQTLRAYGLANQLGADVKARRTAMQDLIGGDVSADEFKTRIDTVVSRVTTADKSIKDAMSSFYGIKEDDLVGYFLNPKDSLPKLQEKVTAAEIGAAAAGQNLLTSKTAAEDLAKFGITKNSAREGYATIGGLLPTATKLGSIYGDSYSQATAEEEVFKGTASAKRKRERLAEQEVGSFSGTSGRLRTGQQRTNQGSF